MSSNEPMKNGCEVIYEMFHILNCGFDFMAVKTAMIMAYLISNPQFNI